MSKIRLNVLGLSYSQTQSGAYALILSEEDGNRRIPIIIGGFEAQAIAIELEGLKPPRPLTHDLFLSFAQSFDIIIEEVTINKLEEGVFYSQLICAHNKTKLIIDSRTSDAIALALRFKCPIYTTEEILKKSGIVLEIEKGTSIESSEVPETKKTSTKKQTHSEGMFENIDIEELNKMLSDAIKNEDYERASKIRDEITRRKTND